MEEEKKSGGFFSRFFQGIFDVLTFKWLFKGKKEKETQENSIDCLKRDDEEPEVTHLTEEELREAKGESQEKSSTGSEKSEKTSSQKSEELDSDGPEMGA